MALEFLSTYGWAFFVGILILLGMAYFVAFNQAALLPASCDFPRSSGVECVSAEAFQDGTLVLKLYNHGGDLRFADAACTYEDGASVTTKAVMVEGLPVKGEPFPADRFRMLSCRFDGDNPFAGQADRKKLLTVPITLLDGESELAVTGRVRVLVEP